MFKFILNFTEQSVYRYCVSCTYKHLQWPLETSKKSFQNSGFKISKFTVNQRFARYWITLIQEGRAISGRTYFGTLFLTPSQLDETCQTNSSAVEVVIVQWKEPSGRNTVCVKVKVPKWSDSLSIVSAA